MKKLKSFFIEHETLSACVVAFFFLGILFSQHQDGEAPINDYRGGFTTAGVLIVIYLIYKFGKKMGEYSNKKEEELDPNDYISK